MYNIQVLNKISEQGTKHFSDDYKLSDNGQAPDAILLRSADLHSTDLPSSVKAIARAGAGVNNIPLDKCTEQGIVVFNTPGANANAVKELVLCGLLLSSRKVSQGVNWLKNYEGDTLAKDVEKNKSQFKGPEIYGKTLGVIGLGAIGMLVANAAESLGMKVIGFDPYISVDSAWKLSQNVKRAKSLESLLQKSDYISLHLPLLESTTGFLNEEKFAQMKDDVRIMNFARGGLVNDDDLLKAIAEKKVASYVTDFPNDKLANNENVVCIPHLGASTPESESNCAVMAVLQLKDYLENGNIKNSVNFPEASLARNGEARLTITNKNIPKMVGQITNVLAEQDINISAIINKNRGDLAYNIIDVDSNIDDNVIQNIEAIEGVLSVRYIS